MEKFNKELIFFDKEGITSLEKSVDSIVDIFLVIKKISNEDIYLTISFEVKISENTYHQSQYGCTVYINDIYLKDIILRADSSLITFTIRSNHFNDSILVSLNFGSFYPKNTTLQFFNLEMNLFDPLLIKNKYCYNKILARIHYKLLKKNIYISNEDQLSDYCLRIYNNKKSFLLIRLGDGEARLLSNNHLSITTTLNENLLYMFGIDFILEAKLFDRFFLNNYLSYLKSSLVLAINNADILGLPEPKHYSQDNFQLNREGAFYFVDLINSVGNLLSINPPKKDLALIDTYFFRNNPFNWLPKVTSVFDQIIIISPYTEELLTPIINSVELSSAKFKFITMPSHSSFKINKFSFKLNSTEIEISNLIASYADKQTLFLIGAGVLGKIFALKAKALDASAIDVGGFFDIATQTSSRPLGATESIYNKL
jgi:hypothetical protein